MNLLKPESSHLCLSTGLSCMHQLAVSECSSSQTKCPCMCNAQHCARVLSYQGLIRSLSVQVEDKRADLCQHTVNSAMLNCRQFNILRHLIATMPGPLQICLLSGCNTCIKTHKMSIVLLHDFAISVLQCMLHRYSTILDICSDDLPSDHSNLFSMVNLLLDSGGKPLLD